MEIIKKFKSGKEGNDCWINDYIMLIHLDSNLYLVTLTEIVHGSWTGTSKTTTSETFDDYDRALNYYDSIISRFER